MSSMTTDDCLTVTKPMLFGLASTSMSLITLFMPQEISLWASLPIIPTSHPTIQVQDFIFCPRISTTLSTSSSAMVSPHA